MSTFGGTMVEYPQIAIDMFQGDEVLRARGYFLSHCHADHMVGLGSRKFADRISRSLHIKLFCSEVTHELLLADPRFNHLRASLCSLPIEQPTTITLVNELNGQEEKLLVTLLPAGHCPGSVMFLFEGDKGTVLYTGDFRLSKGEAARMEALHSGSRIKDITSVYLDTTFCVPEAMFIPSREESKVALLEVVEKQISQGPGHMVSLSCKAKYGYEYLFVAMSKAFNQKVHVLESVLNQYKHVPDLAEHLTTDGSTTQIHACKCKSCSLRSAADLMIIQPSTMWFTSNAGPGDVIRKVGHKYRLCFSFHSSFSEIRDFVGYIRPKNIYPNVIPYDCTEQEINDRLQDLLRGETSTPGTGDVIPTFKPLGKLKVLQGIHRKRQHDIDEDSCSLFDTSPDFKQKCRKVMIKSPPTEQSQDLENVNGSLNSQDVKGEDDNEGRLGGSEDFREVKETVPYGCTFADSDGVLSDSDSEESENNNLSKSGGGDTKTRTDEALPSTAEDCKPVRTLFKAKAESRKAGEDSREAEDEQDSEPFNPSQSSVNEGSIALFSDDSLGGSQESGQSCNNWLQYLPPKQPSGFMSPWKKRNGTDQPSGSPQSPFLISDDSDSDATNIFSQPSQHSQLSDGSEVNIITMSPENSRESTGSITPSKDSTSGQPNERVRGQRGQSKEMQLTFSQGSFASSGSSVIEID